MLFNSLQYLIFFPTVFFLYWFIAKNNRKQQNILLLLSSYFFYGLWDWRFLFLLIFSTFLDYYTGLKIKEAPSKGVKKTWMLISVLINLGFLGFFKYYNFFIDSFAALLTNFGFTPHFSTLQIILPVGISFYTFHGLSYVFDIYYKDAQPTKNWIDYSVFVSFFPLLVAGPIERASHLLPQIEKEREFSSNKATDGLKQILWGLFKKVVVADTCAEYVNIIFNDYSHQSGSTLLIGAVLFSFQIYGDFSGYSDIALGSARLLGFELLKNFSYPYFSRDIAEFWRRWHISLSSWFRDYVYIPLGGSKKGKTWAIFNTFIIFTLSGFWHGANWTFVIWGLLNAIYFLPLLITEKNRRNIEIVGTNKNHLSLQEIIQITFTFFLVTLAWIFFRSETISQSLEIIQTIFSSSLLKSPENFYETAFIYIIILLIIEWMGRKDHYGIQTFLQRKKRIYRWLFYYTLIVLILINNSEGQQFIYFQF